MKENGRPPIIIIGMHRSGTGMLAFLLEKLGLFVGKKKEENNEAWFFLRINRWLLRQCGGAWDYPQPCRQLILNSELRANAADYIRFLMESFYVISFLGWQKYLFYRTLQNLDISWGWKDPRNTFTLPLWLDIFPDAKVIHIYRHGVDVAQSLKMRQERFQRRLNTFKNLHKLFYWVRQYDLLLTPRCASLKGGISLWEEYVYQARVHIDQLEERAMEIKYENFVGKPEEHLKSLCHFCGLQVKKATIEEIKKKVRKRRAYAYLENPELKRFADQVADRLQPAGY
jgi:hypothetical protein